MSNTISGFEPTTQGLTIDKDPQAQLNYTFDWSQWLPENSTVESVDYTVQARVNDPQPLTKINQGILDGTKTYVELASGQLNKVYTVFCEITTDNALVERRSFRVRVVTRSA